MSVSLTSRQRARLKALAHPLEPIMQIGKTGAQPAVVAEVNTALTAHGLIKVKINDSDRDAREEIGNAVAEATDSAIVQRVGKVVVFWRPRPEDAPTTEPGASRARKQSPLP
jgi:putative YhbY family RNA-binding protein